MGRPTNAVVASDVDQDHESFLGWFSMFTNPDEAVSGSRFLHAWASNGLNVNDLPEVRQPVHIFQSACASVKARSRQADGTRSEITADEISNTGAECSYQITSKVWDRKGREITFERGLRATFDKRTSQIKFDEFDQRLSNLATAIEAHFHANATTIPGPKVRNAVREQIIRIGGQNLRRKAGGVYFVPAKSLDGEDTKETLDGLAGVLTALYGDRGDFYTLPMLNGDGEREMVQKHFVVNVAAEAEQLAIKALNRVRQGKGDRAVRSDLLAGLFSQRRQLSAAVKQYEELVNLDADSLKGNLAVLDDALSQLQDLADEGAE